MRLIPLTSAALLLPTLLAAGVAPAGPETKKITVDWLFSDESEALLRPSELRNSNRPS